MEGKIRDGKEELEKEERGNGTSMERRERERRVEGGRILIQADTSTASHEIKKIR